MKGISYITDTSNRKRAIVIELDELSSIEEEVHELIDVLVAESRAEDELLDWEKAKEALKAQGKL